jgi:ferritin-like metal-binding protein YciE
VGLLVAGPIVAALAGAGAGAAAGGVIGGLIGLGIPEHQVKYFQDAIEKGSVLVGVKVPEDREEWAESILEAHGAQSPTTITAPAEEVDADALPAATGATAAAGFVAGRTAGRGRQDADDWARRGGLRRLFAEQMKDIYYAEKRLVDALPEMRDAASNANLKQAFADHLAETQQHVIRLEQAFASMGVTPEEERCPAMNGIITEAKQLMKLDDTPALRDAALICAAQKAEHYEIVTYGCLRSYAQTLGLPTVENLLNQTLEEEIETDEYLSDLAEQGINQGAAGREEAPTISTKRAAPYTEAAGRQA